MSLHIHVGEPLSFERGNGTCELFGWTSDHLEPAADAWIVHLDAPFTIEDEAFNQACLSPRYFGESLQRVMNPLVNLAVNIVPHGRTWAEREERPLAMAGTVVRHRESH